RDAACREGAPAARSDRGRAEGATGRAEAQARPRNRGRGLRARCPAPRSDPGAGDRDVMLDVTTITDFGLAWLEASGPFSDIVLSTRVRLARNLQGHPFGKRMREGEREQIYERVRAAADRSA